MACTDYPLCRNAYYESQIDGVMLLKCRLNDDVCVYSRYCNSLLRIIHTSSYTQCTGGKG